LIPAGVVTALSSEARTLGRPRARRGGLLELVDGTRVIVSGMGRTAAAAAARALLDEGVSALVSWGMAGGLDPMLVAGTICVPEIVVTRDGNGFVADPHWREMVIAAITSRYLVAGGHLLTTDEVIIDSAAKAAAFHETGAVAVDMESAAIAAVAASRKVPFIAVRVVVDTANDELPASVLSATREGRLSLLQLVRGLASRPRDVAPLLRLAQRYRAARGALLAVARSGVLAPLAFATSLPGRIA
jgi:adenosylhomocysteine nucleosidase